MQFLLLFFVFFFKQKTAYEMRISDWSSDVCSSDLALALVGHGRFGRFQDVDLVGAVQAVIGRTRDRLDDADFQLARHDGGRHQPAAGDGDDTPVVAPVAFRSEEHTSELQSLMRISYAVFCLKKKKKTKKSTKSQ